MFFNECIVFSNSEQPQHLLHIIGFNRGFSDMYFYAWRSGQ